MRKLSVLIFFDGCVFVFSVLFPCVPSEMGVSLTVPYCPLLSLAVPLALTVPPRSGARSKVAREPPLSKAAAAKRYSKMETQS